MNRDQVLAAVEHILSLILTKRLEEVPAMFRPMLSKFSPENLIAMLKEEITDADWIKIEEILTGTGD